MLPTNIFPWTNFHELNLEWILGVLKEIETTMTQFVAINSLKYADPIQWDITRQYEKNTIVIDPLTGTAYISVQPVPLGVIITNTDYWSVVFDLQRFVTRANTNFTLNVEEQTTLNATFPTPLNGWLVWGDTLYKALTNIVAGDQYVENSNIERITVESVTGHPEELTTLVKTNLVAAINELVTTINTICGDLADLNTTDKSNLVNAINEVLATINTICGDLATLTTTDKSSLVNAINEVLTTINTICGDLATLTTTDKSNLVNAINEVLTTVYTNCGDLADLNTTDKSNLVNAINEVLTTVNTVCGDLADLNTTDKSNLVNAINEVLAKTNGLILESHHSVSATADGAKTYGELMAEVCDKLLNVFLQPGYSVQLYSLRVGGFMIAQSYQGHLIQYGDTSMDCRFTGMNVYTNRFRLGYYRLNSIAANNNCRIMQMQPSNPMTGTTSGTVTGTCEITDLDNMKGTITGSETGTCSINSPMTITEYVNEVATEGETVQLHFNVYRGYQI